MNLLSLTPALSHPMGEGESSSLSLKNLRAGFAGRLLKNREAFDCCPLSRPTGEGQGEGGFGSAFTAKQEVCR